jgi:hypothetical protein
MVLAHDAFWGAWMEQMCYQCDKNVPLPPCFETATVTFIRTYGCNDNEIPSLSLEGRISPSTYPPREALSGVLRASLVMTRTTLRPTSCRRQLHLQNVPAVASQMRRSSGSPMPTSFVRMGPYISCLSSTRL